MASLNEGVLKEESHVKPPLKTARFYQVKRGMSRRKWLWMSMCENRTQAHLERKSNESSRDQPDERYLCIAHWSSGDAIREVKKEEEEEKVF